MMSWPRKTAKVLGIRPSFSNKSKSKSSNKNWNSLTDKDIERAKKIKLL